MSSRLFCPRSRSAPLVLAAALACGLDSSVSGQEAVVPPSAATAAAPAELEEPKAAERETVDIEPYTGPPIFLPEPEAPPEPSEAESRVIKENYEGTENPHFERRIVRFSDDSVVSDGPHKEYHVTGELYVEGAFARGRAVGKWVYHHPNGSVAKEVTYVQGEPDGEVVVRDAEGKLKSRRQYSKGKRDGVWNYYGDSEEQPTGEERYAQGKADGEWKTWYANGQVSQLVTFAAGKQHGVLAQWSLDGEKRLEANFKDGQRDGVTRVWRRDGEVVEQTFKDGELVSSETKTTPES